MDWGVDWSSPFWSGTNTYLITGDASSILIDTGQGIPSYIPILTPVLRVSPPVSNIILTHRHHDHVGGLKSVLKAINDTSRESNRPSPIEVKVWKYKRAYKQHNPPLKDTDPDAELIEDLLAARDIHPDQEGSYLDTSMRWLSDGQSFQLSDQAHLSVLHTPGHTNDSISCMLFSTDRAEQEPLDDLEAESARRLRAIFVGDTVLGGSSSVFDDLSLYLHSLNKLVSIIQPLAPQLVRLYPGHGEVIEDGLHQIHQYIHHRTQREEQILAILLRPPPPLSWSSPESVYTLPFTSMCSKFLAERALMSHLTRVGS